MEGYEMKVEDLIKELSQFNLCDEISIKEICGEVKEISHISFNASVGVLIICDSEKKKS